MDKAQNLIICNFCQAKRKIGDVRNVNKKILSEQRSDDAKNIEPHAFFLLYAPDFVDHLLRNSWLLKAISVCWNTEYGSGIFNIHIIRSNVSLFIRKQ